MFQTKIKINRLQVNNLNFKNPLKTNCVSMKIKICDLLFYTKYHQIFISLFDIQYSKDSG